MDKQSTFVVCGVSGGAASTAAFLHLLRSKGSSWGYGGRTLGACSGFDRAIVNCGVPGSLTPLDVPLLVLADVEDKWWDGCAMDQCLALYGVSLVLDCQAGS